jgi:hypothetical protein
MERGINMSFEMNDEMKKWAKELMSGLGIGGIWSPEGSGLTYKKMSDDTLLLTKMMNHPDVLENHARFTTIMMAIGINMAENENVLFDAPANPEEAYMLEQQHKIDIAHGWKCECGSKLIEMPHEKYSPRFLSEEEVLLENGDTDTMEIWGYLYECPDCDKAFNVDPDDYHLMAGDKLFMRYRIDSERTMQAMTRREMIQAAKDQTGILVGDSCPITGGKVPTWLWGTYCYVIVNDEEE